MAGEAAIGVVLKAPLEEIAEGIGPRKTTTSRSIGLSSEA